MKCIKPNIKFRMLIIFIQKTIQAHLHFNSKTMLTNYQNDHLQAKQPILSNKNHHEPCSRIRILLGCSVDDVCHRISRRRKQQTSWFGQASGLQRRKSGGSLLGRSLQGGRQQILCCQGSNSRQRLLGWLHLSKRTSSGREVRFGSVCRRRSVLQ